MLLQLLLTLHELQLLLEMLVLLLLMQRRPILRRGSERSCGSDINFLVGLYLR